MDKKQLKNAAQCANFMQKFKMLYWDEHDHVFGVPIPSLPEIFLDKIAMEIFDYSKKQFKSDLLKFSSKIPKEVLSKILSEL